MRPLQIVSSMHSLLASLLVFFRGYIPMIIVFVCLLRLNVTILSILFVLFPLFILSIVIMSISEAHGLLELVGVGNFKGNVINILVLPARMRQRRGERSMIFLVGFLLYSIFVHINIILFLHLSICYILSLTILKFFAICLILYKTFAIGNTLL